MYVYDLESFPNFFSAVFRSIEEPSDTRSFVLHEQRNDSRELVGFLEGLPTLVGYNNHSYDDLLLNLILKRRPGNNPGRLNRASNHIINAPSIYTDDKVKELVFGDLESIDLMKLLGFDKAMISLKHIAVKLRHDRIQDLPRAHDAMIGGDEIEDVLDYNFNDVLITEKLFHETQSARNMRKQLGDHYNVKLSSASDSIIADKLMAKFYLEYTGEQWNDVRQRRTERDAIPLSNVIASDVYFESDRLQLCKDRVHDYVVGRNTSKVIDNFKFGYSSYNLARGGIHSVNAPTIFTNKDFELVDVDVAAYYPNLGINMKVSPRHLSDNFPEIYRNIVDARLKAKANKKNDPLDGVIDEGLKISINSVFGKMGYINSWLYDLEQLYRITINGQLYLLMLIEWLEEAQFPVIYANTDGITAQVKSQRMDEFNELCDKWQNHTQLMLEYSFYQKMVVRDVNNYLILDCDGKRKEKGAFMTKDSQEGEPVAKKLSKAYSMPVLSEAVKAYFIDGIEPQVFIPQQDDILDFCLSQKVGKQYDLYYVCIVYDDHDQPNETFYKLQKTNRFYLSKKGGKLLKHKREEDRWENMVKDRKVTILNDYAQTGIQYHEEIDYSFYIAEAWKMISDCTNGFQTQLL